MRFLFILAISVMGLLLFCSWGFYAHMRINRMAVFSLPSGLNLFYKENIRYISEHAVDADKRRYTDTAEAPRHYLDVELYETSIDSIPRKWDDALKKYGAAKLQSCGTLPWQVQRSYYQLVKAFKNRDAAKILSHSANLGHYIADAHVPLHTTQNHNGQLTNQHGIHAFWESHLPELFAANYNYLTGSAQYIESPLQEIWKVITHTHHLADSVLRLEAQLNTRFSAYRKYTFSKRKGQVTRQYAMDYAKAYHDAMNHMVERQMRASIRSTGSFWYSAWIDAGQPELKNVKIKKGKMNREDALVIPEGTALPGREI